MRSVVENATAKDVWLGKDIVDEGEPDTPSSRPLVTVCGVCGHRFKAYRNGPWEDTDELTEVLCPSCDNACFRRSVIVTTNKIAEERLSDRQSVQRYVRDRAHWDFWQSKVASSTAADDEAAFLMSSETPITAHLVQSSITPVDWEPECPVCGCNDGSNEFDFHHWDYEEDIGVQLCRDCHDYAHDGKRVSDTAESDWESESLERLITRMKEQNPDDRISKKRLNFPSKKATPKQ
jgi:NMD protein affecting ribosome stability and mRNA decay